MCINLAAGKNATAVAAAIYLVIMISRFPSCHPYRSFVRSFILPFYLHHLSIHLSGAHHYIRKNTFAAFKRCKSNFGDVRRRLVASMCRWLLLLLFRVEYNTNGVIKRDSQMIEERAWMQNYWLRINSSFFVLFARHKYSCTRTYPTTNTIYRQRCWHGSPKMIPQRSFASWYEVETMPFA